MKAEFESCMKSIIPNRHILTFSFFQYQIHPPIPQMSIDGLQSALNEGIPLHLDFPPLDSVRDSAIRLCTPCTLSLARFALSDEIVNGPVSVQARQAQVRAAQWEGEREGTEMGNLFYRIIGRWLQNFLNVPQLKNNKNTVVSNKPLKFQLDNHILKVDSLNFGIDEERLTQNWRVP